MWKVTDSDIAYLRQGNFALSLGGNGRKSLAAHKYSPAVGVDNLVFTCADFGGLPSCCGGTGGVYCDSGERHLPTNVAIDII